MGKTILLNTATTNFLTLIGNGKIFKVPQYQRDYSWEIEHWDDLWTDIYELRGNADKFHYMGALVVEGKSDREFLIIDGQQRLASLSLLALAVISQLEKMVGDGIDAQKNKERATELRARFIGEKDPASLVETSKLFLNETDNAFYQDYLIQLRTPINPRGLPKSNKSLWECFKFFKDKIASVPEFATDGKSLTELLSETVGRQLMFILITVEDQLNAYTVFETLNARGLELSSTDLLKNYLFSRVSVSADLSALQRRWRSVITVVGQERFPEFLRYHLLCTHPKIRTQRLFKLIRDNVSTSAEVFGLMGDLEARAELFSALHDVNHGFWVERPECQPWIRELSLFRVRQMTPVLFAAWEKFQPVEFMKTLKLVSAISFRYSVISGLNTNELEPVYHQAAKAVLEQRAQTASDVFKYLRSIYVDDKKFEQDFSQFSINTSGQRKKLAKYILCKLEEEASGRPTHFSTDPGTIEHILPENPSAGWEGMFRQDSWDACIYRLGNLSLMEISTNREVGNADYAAKILAYVSSVYLLTRKIPSEAPTEWSIDLLEARQAKLAKRALHIWKSDFS